MEEEGKNIEESIKRGIEKAIGINKFAEAIWEAYPDIPKEVLGNAVKNFISSLNDLERIIELIGKVDDNWEEIEKHIPRID